MSTCPTLSAAAQAVIIKVPPIALDIDGTIAKPNWSTNWTIDVIGDPYPGAMQFIRDLSERGQIVIHSCRGSTMVGSGHTPLALRDMMARWLTKHAMIGFIHEIWVGQGKPVAAAYIDDRGVTCNPDEVGPDQAFATALARVDHLVSTW